MTIQELYDKYKHLDIILSDPVWMREEENQEGQLINHVLFDMWKTIKETITGRE